MKLESVDIQTINNYLVKQGVKYLDVRLELIDHLGCEFEANASLVSIEDFLITKQYFIKTFADKRQRTLHWSYQRLLWKQFVLFFYKLKLIPIPFLLCSTILLIHVNPNADLTKRLFMTMIIIPHVITLIIYLKKQKIFKNVLSAQPLLSIMSLPSLYIYIPNIFSKGFLFEHYYVAFFFLFFGSLLSLSGLIVYINQKNKIIKLYETFV